MILYNILFKMWCFNSFSELVIQAIEWIRVMDEKALMQANNLTHKNPFNRTECVTLVKWRKQQQ